MISDNTKLDTESMKYLFEIWSGIMRYNRDYLIQLDSIVGDSDLGLTMSDGFEAAHNAVEKLHEKDVGYVIYTAGMAMSRSVPSTMGTLMASGLIQAAKEFKSATYIRVSEMSKFFRAFFNGVKNRGGANIGEKTFLDGLGHAVIFLEANNNNPNQLYVAKKAACIAERDFLATKTMLAVHGRAAIHGDASREFVDAGAAVAKLLMKGYAIFLEQI